MIISCLIIYGHLIQFGRFGSLSLGNYYSGKRVLVTGHTGFKGSWLSIWLKKLGAKVAGYSLEPKTSKDNFALAGVADIAEHNIGDVREKEHLEKVLKNFNPDIIFHLAAQPLVLEGYTTPYETFDVNYRGTLNILELFRTTETIKSLICITTDKVYENKEWLWGYRETDRLGGNDPYSASKSSSELLINSYIKSFFLNSDKNVATVRAGNVIGGGDWSEYRIVPDFFRAIENSQPLEIRNPGSVRPWQFVLEPLYGYLLLGEKLDKGEKTYSSAWNFGPGKDKFVDVKTLIEDLQNLNPGSQFTISNTTNFPKEANFLFLDSIKAYKYLNWESKLSFKETLRMTSEWYNKYPTDDVYELCLNQIKYYEELWK